MSVGSPRAGHIPCSEKTTIRASAPTASTIRPTDRIDGAEHVDQRPVADSATADVREQRVVGLDRVPQQVRRVMRLRERDEREVRRQPADQAACELAAPPSPLQDSRASATSARLDGLSCDGGRSCR